MLVRVRSKLFTRLIQSSSETKCRLRILYLYKNETCVFYYVNWNMLSWASCLDHTVTNTHVLQSQTVDPTGPDVLMCAQGSLPRHVYCSHVKGTVARDFWPSFFSWIYSIWNSDFEAKRIFFSFSFSRNYSNFSMNPRSSLLRGFKKNVEGFQN